MRWGPAVAALALLTAACGPARSPAPDSGVHSYLLFDPPSQEQGWKLVDALTPRAAGRVRTAGLTGSGAGTMFVDFTGTCDGQAQLVADATRIAGTLGIAGLRCTATAPTG